MSYDDKFYLMYDEYLEDPVVRKQHSLAVSGLMAMGPIGAYRVVELGCGAGDESEFLRILRDRKISRPDPYLGIDLNAGHPPLGGNNLKFGLLKADYRDWDVIGIVQQLYKPDTVVSLFSSEITANSDANYTLYRGLFARFPSLQQIIVSGFYYSSKTKFPTVAEPGGVTSFQTLDRPDQVKQKELEEYRLTMHVPSKLFGPDVYEVWKLFTRVQ